MGLDTKILSNYKTQVSDINFLSTIIMEKELIKNKKYIITITIPKYQGEFPFIVKDKKGKWNKWVRIGSCCSKVNHPILELLNETKVDYLKKNEELKEKLAILKKLNTQANEIGFKRNRNLIEKEEENKVLHQYIKNIINPKPFLHIRSKKTRIIFRAFLILNIIAIVSVIVNLKRISIY